MVELALPILGTIPQWIAAFSTTGVFGFIGTMWLKSRKLGIGERQDARQGYGDLLDRLNKDVDKLKKINVKLYSRMTKCDAGYAAMKLRVGEMHFVLRLQNQKLVQAFPADDPVLVHAQELLAVVYPTEEPEAPDDELDTLVGELP